MQDQPLVAAIIVNYNSEESTRRCIASLFESGLTRLLVIVVDNDSTDGSGGRLQRDPGVGFEVVCVPENQGFAAGVNIGLKIASVKGATHFWVLNPDIIVGRDAGRQLLVRAEELGIPAILGGKIFRGIPEAGSKVLWSAGAAVDSRMHETIMFGAGEEDSEAFNTPRECDYVPGCSMFFSSETLEQVGYLPEEYFLYFEETEWCSRAREHGVRVEYVPTSEVWHDSSVTKMQTPLRVYYYNRSRRLFWSKRMNPIQRLLAKLGALTIDIPKAWGASTASNDEDSRAVFFAHRKSAHDFAFGQFGKSSHF